MPPCTRSARGASNTFHDIRSGTPVAADAATPREPSSRASVAIKDQAVEVRGRHPVRSVSRLLIGRYQDRRARSQQHRWNQPLGVRWWFRITQSSSAEIAFAAVNIAATFSRAQDRKIFRAAEHNVAGRAEKGDRRVLEQPKCLDGLQNTQDSSAGKAPRWPLHQSLFLWWSLAAGASCPVSRQRSDNARRSLSSDTGFIRWASKPAVSERR